MSNPFDDDFSEQISTFLCYTTIAVVSMVTYLLLKYSPREEYDMNSSYTNFRTDHFKGKNPENMNITNEAKISEGNRKQLENRI